MSGGFATTGGGGRVASMRGCKTSRWRNRVNRRPVTDAGIWSGRPTKRGEWIANSAPSIRAARILPYATARCGARCQETSRRDVSPAVERSAFRTNDGEKAAVAEPCWIGAIGRKAKTVLRRGGRRSESSGALRGHPTAREGRRARSSAEGEKANRVLP